MYMLRKLQVAVLAAGLCGHSVVLASRTQIETRSINDIYKAAQAESGTLNVYFGGSCTFYHEKLYLC